MKPYYQHTFLRALFFGPLALILASCGSYQYAGYDHDGIYSDGTSVAETYTDDTHEESYENALYYQQVFSQKAEQFGEMAQGNTIFTDIDSYSSGAYQDETYMEDQYQGAYGGWGDQADEIAINIYNNPYMYSPFPYYNHFYSPYSNWYYGYGYHHGYPYYSPWRYGHHFGPWGYASIGWGFGYSPWGYGYNNWNYGYYNPYQSYYSVSNVSYSNSRRYSVSDYSDSALRRSDATSSRRYSTNNVSASRRSSDNTVTRSTRATNDNRTYRTRRSSDSSPVYRSTRSTERTRTYTPAKRTRTETYTPSRSTRSSNSGTYRSPAPVRSSGSSTRGGGTSRSTRGRGN